MNYRCVILLLLTSLLWSCNKTEEPTTQLDEAETKILPIEEQTEETETIALELDTMSAAELRRTQQIELIQWELAIRQAWDEAQSKAVHDYFLRKKAEDSVTLIKTLKSQHTADTYCGHDSLITWHMKSEAKNEAARHDADHLHEQLYILTQGGEIENPPDQAFPFYLPAFGLDEKITKPMLDDWKALQAKRLKL